MTDLFALDALRDVERLAGQLAVLVAALPRATAIEALNRTRAALHAAGPFRDEPVDLVLWIPEGDVVANDYNPNRVAAPEMQLLERSIEADGYTQPVVAHAAEQHVVVDGFHRSRIGKECRAIRERLGGYLPVVHIRAGRAAIQERMASTIRHNRARGKHAVEPMTGIVAYLVRKGWDDARIGRELGMEADEVLRMKQITGLAELFAERPFSEAWTLE